MKFFVAFLFFLCLIIPGTEGQISVSDPDTIVEIDGQYFMPYSRGVLEKSLVVAPGIARMKPSQVNLIKRKLNACSLFFLNDSLFNPLKGLKIVIKEEVFPEQGLHEWIRYIPSSCSVSLFTTLVKDSIPFWDITPEAWLTVHFNNPEKLVGNPVIKDIYPEPVLTDTDLKWVEFDRVTIPDRILVTKKSNLNWFEPVSREDFILTLIAFFQGSVEKAEKKSAASPLVSTNSTVHKALELQKFIADLNKIRKFDPELADRLMLQYLEAGAQNPGEQGGGVDITIVLNSWKEAVRKLKAEMNAMSPLERKSQAWWSDTEDSNVSGLTPAGYSGSRPLVRLNRNMIDRTKPASSIQLIIMESSMLPGSEFVDTEGYNLAYFKLTSLWNNMQLRQQLFNLLDP